MYPTNCHNVRSQVNTLGESENIKRLWKRVKYKCDRSNAELYLNKALDDDNSCRMYLTLKRTLTITNKNSCFDKFKIGPIFPIYLHRPQPYCKQRGTEFEEVSIIKNVNSIVLMRLGTTNV